MGRLRQTLAVGRPLASTALVVAGLLLAAGPAQVQTPILSLQATFSPFSPGQTITITASVTMHATIDSGAIWPSRRCRAPTRSTPSDAVRPRPRQRRPCTV